ncbi:metal ABC transporter ATP-binding protein [Shimwellia pseudoproteus]|uniref:metal ABC transporter ATP-binding protein n=1 Tax=Shimwellia pseudoproteus TaxID=570012 RepID=UPI0018EC5D9C|nr:metal ABC transporter ATP-binding protein [Shimwellia pseudoproteus]MBJ3816881.1 metal ABC transporter ATP-binding protein [Shimwellia pseudoproteus]
MITLENLVTGYQGHPLSQPISGTFRAGSMTAIIGANGTGKSTLLRTLAGLQPAVSGTLRRQPLACTGWLPQQHALDHQFPITVHDVVAMGCWPQRSMWRGLGGGSRQRIMSALDQVGIRSLAEHTIDTLSGGQFQRMLFARLLVQDAPLLLMDEPFTGIDSQTSEALLALMCQLHRQGKTLLVVLHNLAMVQRAFPETLCLHQEYHHWGPTNDVADRLALAPQHQGAA